jgi:hypothetical protein
MKNTELISLILVCFACLMTFLIILGLFFIAIPKENQQMVNIFGGVIITGCLALIYNYRFGSSKGSADKTASMLKTNEEQKPTVQ